MASPLGRMNMDKFDEIKAQLEQLQSDIATLVRLVEAESTAKTKNVAHQLRRAEARMVDAVHYFSIAHTDYER